MGQARNRKEEIEQLKAKGYKVNPEVHNFGLVDYMYKLGDGDWADETRASLLNQVLDVVIAQLPFIASNLVRGKTTEADGIQVGFEADKLTTIANYHIWIEDPSFIIAIREFKQMYDADPKLKLSCGMMGSKDTKAIVPFMAFMGKTTNIVITKDPRIGHTLRFMPAEGIAKFDADLKDINKTAKEMADFLA